jgi:hypothetical protein
MKSKKIKSISAILAASILTFSSINFVKAEEINKSTHIQTDMCANKSKKISYKKDKFRCIENKKELIPIEIKDGEVYVPQIFIDQITGKKPEMVQLKSAAEKSGWTVVCHNSTNEDYSSYVELTKDDKIITIYYKPNGERKVIFGKIKSNKIANKHLKK